jgi:hypothetical protein
MSAYIIPVLFLVLPLWLLPLLPQIAPNGNADYALHDEQNRWKSG